MACLVEKGEAAAVPLAEAKVPPASTTHKTVVLLPSSEISPLGSQSRVDRATQQSQSLQLIISLR